MRGNNKILFMAWDMDRDLPDTSNAAIGNRLAAIRIARDWTQAFAAKLVGVSSQRWGNWERGLNAPPPDCLARIWQVSGATSDYVLFGRMDGLPLELAEALRAARGTQARNGAKAG